MKNEQKYTIFRVSCGFFAILGANGAVFRTFLPTKNKDDCVRNVLNTPPGAIVDNLCFLDTAELVKAYYDGVCVDFSKVRVNLDNKTEFSKKVLTTLRTVKYGQTITYGQLAQKCGHPGAFRAVGTVLANNKIPLIIPCHRVIKSTGEIGNFSAEGGSATKQEMLDLELLHNRT